MKNTLARSLHRTNSATSTLTERLRRSFFWAGMRSPIPIHLLKKFLVEWRYSLQGQRKGFGLEGLDLRLLHYLQPEAKRGGYFVELGANNGLFQSNTYLLQQHFGWTGLLIEPSPIQYIECIRNRGFGQRPDFRCAACVDFNYRQPFVEMRYSDLMTVALDLNCSRDAALDHAGLGETFLQSKEEAHVFGAVARTLTSLLDEVSAPREFDLLCLDVEGNELSVLRGIDFSRYQPEWILVEVRSADIHDLLHFHHYREVAVLTDNQAYRDVLFRHL